MTAARPSRPLWVGDYIRWWGGADWEWIACVKCGRPLTTRTAQRDGFGRECAAVVTHAMIERVKQAEHEACALALEVHQTAQTQSSPWWSHQAYLKRQSVRRRRGSAQP
jgi:hypothetical protein